MPRRVVFGDRVVFGAGGGRIVELDVDTFEVKSALQ
jgi:hypothetical protein